MFLLEIQFFFHLRWHMAVINANDIFIGVNALDYSGYPDCRPEFIESLKKLQI